MFEVLFGLGSEFGGDGLHEGFEVAGGLFNLVQGVL